MSEPVSLLFGVHAHQPVGNFPEVIDDAHNRCYRPFLKVLHGHPDFHFAVHFSGWLLDYLFERFPEDMNLLREMVERGQVELFGAGDTEPVLAAIPNRDRIGQLERFSNKLETRLGSRPQGAWLTERVWESTVVPSLVECGMKYVIVDDYHFLCSGKDLSEMDGYFSTEEDGRRLDLFPISESLRYKLPFSPAGDAVSYIESLSGGERSKAAIYFDDIEKFGIWPETFQWVYEEGWLDRFVSGVVASSKIRSCHYRDYHSSERTHGVVYLPTTSYIEMNEWTLPADRAGVYSGLVQHSKVGGSYDQDKPFLRGGIWKNFFSIYPESNWMHKRMLGLSSRLDGLPKALQTNEMRGHLYESQSNDAYWHGLFGGLYLPHLRRAVYKALVRLESVMDECSPRPDHFIEDTDLDGVGEVYLQNGTVQLVLKLDGFASVCEMDSYPLGHNFGDTLRRQSEHYHRRILEGVTGSVGGSVGGIVSAHDRVHFKHEISQSDLEIDDHPRSLFVDRLEGVFMHYRYQLSDDGVHFKAEGSGTSVAKLFEIWGDRVDVSYHFTGELVGHFSTEINLSMPSCDGWGGRYIYLGEITGGFGQPLEIDQMDQIILDDDVLGGRLILRASSPVRLSAHPHYSVSQSEGGFERIMQSVTLILAWPVSQARINISMVISARE
ncbi:MAG: alpha-amylase/4-alpha-glucanotransferase domain-containing protein [Nitrosomonadaceae bacterium]